MARSLHGPLSICADFALNLACWWNIVDQCATFAGNYSSDVKVSSFPRRRILAANLFHPGFQFALATQPGVGVAVAQEAPDPGARDSRCSVTRAD